MLNSQFKILQRMSIILLFYSKQRLECFTPAPGTVSIRPRSKEDVIPAEVAFLFDLQMKIPGGFL
jgi:hypothetical protein